MSRILSARNKSASGLAIALEGLEDGDEAVVIEGGDEPVSSELDQEHSELAEAAGDVEEAHEVIEELEDSAEGLESIAISLESTLADGGLTPQAAVFMNHAVATHTARLGMKRSIVPSMESFGGESSRVSATQISMESIKETLTKIWEAIKKACLAVWQAVVAFFDRLFNIAPRIKHKAEQLKAKLKDLKGTPQGEIKVSGLAAKLSVNGKPVGDLAIVKMFGEIGKVAAISEAPFKAGELTKDETGDEVKRKALVQKLVGYSKSSAKGIPGIDASHKSTDSTVSFKSEVLPGNTVFVVTYDIAKEGDSVSSAVAKAVSGPTLKVEGAEGQKATASDQGLEPFGAKDIDLTLDRVIKMADMTIEAKSKISTAEKAALASLEHAKLDLNADEKLDQSAVAAYLRADGKRISNGARLTYQIYKYGAEVMRAYLILCEKSMAAHKEGGEKKDDKKDEKAA